MTMGPEPRMGMPRGSVRLESVDQVLDATLPDRPVA